jgi:hypothetical protein
VGFVFLRGVVESGRLVILRGSVGLAREKVGLVWDCGFVMARGILLRCLAAATKQCVDI